MDLTLIKAKAAVDSVPECRNKVSCADILAMATRDVIALTGGPSYAVELGRLDGRISTKPSVRHHLPRPDFKLDKLKPIFASHGLTLTDLVALSGTFNKERDFSPLISVCSLMQGQIHIVNIFASNNTAFEKAFVTAITKLGRIGVRTGKQGEIRHDCAVVNKII